MDSIKKTIEKYISRVDLQILLMAFALGIIIVCTYNLSVKRDVQRDLQENIIRLHIRGKSNSEVDQSFKIYIRDMVLTYIGDNINKNATKEEIENYITNNSERIEDYVDVLIAQGGYNYISEVEFGLDEFPDKTYGFLTIPGGVYKSLIINLDKGEGNNWWCVVFPPLCYVESEELAFDDESLKTLEKSLDEKTFKSIISKNGRIEMDFKLFEIIDEFIKK